MIEPKQKLREFIAGLEEQRRELDDAIAASWEILTKLDPQAAKEREGPVSAEPTADEHPEPFQRKYDKSAKALVREVLEDVPDGTYLALPEIVGRLSDRGREFHRETVNNGLKSLMKKDEVEKKAAPDDSSYKWIYRLRRGDGESQPSFPRALAAR